MLTNKTLHIYMWKLSERSRHDKCPENFAKRTSHKRILEISPPESLQTNKLELSSSASAAEMHNEEKGGAITNQNPG